MKRHILSLFSVFCLLWGSLEAQEVSVVIEPLTQNFPSQIASYMDNPFRYCRVRVINNSGVTQRVYLTMQLEEQTSGEGGFRLYSQDHGTSRPCITLPVGGSIVINSRESFTEHFSGRLKLKAPSSSPLDYLQIPEGTYRLCVQANRWSEVVSNDQVMSENCLPISICYTGSAPEFTSPILASMQNGITRLEPQRNINVRWSDVITNCASSARFNYVLKIVKVAPGQNVYSAIDNGNVIFSERCGTKTYCLIDTLRDLKLPLERGATYAMMVTATQRNTSGGNLINLSNEGRSQVVAFTWGDGNYGVVADNNVSPQQQTPPSGDTRENTTNGNNEDLVLASIRRPYLTLPYRDDATATQVQTKFIDEKGYTPKTDTAATLYGFTDKGTPVLKDTKFATAFMPVRGDSVKGVKYVVELYEDNCGGMDPSTLHTPIKSLTIDGPLGRAYGDPAASQVEANVKEWQKSLVSGADYFIKLRSTVAYVYHSSVYRTVTHYVNGKEADSETDSVLTPQDGYVTYESSVRFRWGIDSSSLERIAPPQFTYPVNLGSAEWDDTSYMTFGLDAPEIEHYSDFDVAWKKVKGLDLGDSAYYTLYIYDMAKGKEMDALLKGKPKFVVDSLTDNRYAGKYIDSLQTGKGYVMRLRLHTGPDTLKYNLLNKGYSHPIYFKLIDTLTVADALDTRFACFPKDTTGLDMSPVKQDPDNLVRNRVRLKMGRFDLIVQNAKKGVAKADKKADGKNDDKKAGDKKGDDKKGGDKKDGDKKGDDKKGGDKKKVSEDLMLNGEGYVLWHPMGFGCGLKVKFDSLIVNKDNRVIGGYARTIPTDENNYLNLNIGNNRFGAGFDMASDKASTYLDDVASLLGDDGEDVRKWYNYINQGANVISESIHGFAEGEGNLGVLTTPIRINDQMVGAEAQHVLLALNDAFFTPVTAHVNYLAIFNSHKDDIYVPLLATNVCIDTNSLYASEAGDLNLLLAKDFPFPLSDNYTLTLKRPTKLTDVTTGTHISFNKDGFKEFTVTAELDFGYRDDPGNKLIAVNLKNSGVVDPTKSVKGTFSARIAKWDDWVATVKMDPFTIVGCEDWTFVPTGNGLLYDHSSTFTPKGVKLPKDYLDKGQKKEAWQGFYLDQFQVLLPTDVSTTFIDYADQTPPDSTIIYKYGANGQLTDSVQYVLPGSRLAAGAQGLIWDKEGLSVDLFIANLLKLETKRVNWGFSIDTVSVKFLKSSFKYGQIIGRTRIPLFSGNLRYQAQLGTDSLAFKVNLDDKDFTLNLFLAKIVLDEKSSHFTIVHDKSGKNAYTEKDKVTGTEYTLLDKKARTRIDLTLNGTINIDFNKIGLDVSLPGIKFQDMYVRNFTRKTSASSSQKSGGSSSSAKNSHLSQSNRNRNRNSSSSSKQSSSSGNKQSSSSGNKQSSSSSSSKAKEDPKKGKKVDSYVMGPIDFSIGTWSKASPQKYIGFVDEPAEAAVPDEHYKDKNLKGSVGAFSYSVDTIDLFLKSSGKKHQVGIGFAGSMKIGIGTDQSVGARAGFGIQCEFNEDDFSLSKPEGYFDSARLTTNIGPLYVDGYINHKRNDNIYGTCWLGSLDVKVMKVIQIAMAAGFGTKEKPTGSGTFDWWFFEGAAQLDGSGIPLGPLSINGFGGGFAYNMEAAGKAKTSEELMKGGSTSATSMVSKTGLSFKPKYDAWMAKAGISMILTGSENSLSALGQLNLRMANGHFSGITLQLDASIMSSYNLNTKKAGSAMLTASALMDFTDYSATSTVDTGWCLSFSFATKCDLKLDQAFLKESLSEKIGDGLWYPSSSSDRGPDGKGTAMSLSSMLAKVENEDEIKNKQKQIAEGNFGVSASLQIPVDLYVRNYGTKKSPYTNLKTDWYFALGRPEYNRRVSFKANMDLVVYKASTAWTFYFMLGNYFPGGFQLPELPKEVRSFLDKEGKLTKAEKSRSMPKKGATGGFAMGMSFESHVSYNMFLYLDVDAYLGFDGALLYSEGLSCDNNEKIGRNNFYATGQAYALLKGKCGVSLDLGFWKGELTLAEAGLGALLQGGGPNPTWCYGLLAFRASVLGGLAKINTSIDFSLGHVCLPGNGDPLTNVKIFQSVQPGYPTAKEAASTKNLVSPQTDGLIVSNLPWNESILLCAQEQGGAKLRDRKFRFILEANNSHDYYVPKGRNSTYSSTLTFRQDNRDANTLYFESREGGFEGDATHTVYLRARALEYRTSEGLSAADKKKDYCYTTSEWGCSKTKSLNNDYYAWRDPTFSSGKTVTAKGWYKDTTVYFVTMESPLDLENSVVFTWPYNGDPCVPMNEIYKDKKGKYVVPIYTYKMNEKFMPRELKQKDKALHAFLIKRDPRGGVGEARECSVSYERTGYAGSSTPCFVVTLPSSFGTNSDYDKDFALRLYLVDASSYKSNLQSLIEQSQQALSYSVKDELQSRNKKQYQNRLNQHERSKRNKSGSSNKKGGQKTTQTVDLEKSQLQAAINGLSAKDTTLNYRRKKLSAGFQATQSSGSVIYTLYFHTLESTYKDYEDIVNKTDFHKLAQRQTVNKEESRKQVTIDDAKLKRFAYLTMPLETNDKSKYKSGTVLPPIIYMGLNTTSQADSKTPIMPEYQLLNIYAKELANIHRDIKLTVPPVDIPVQDCSESYWDSWKLKYRDVFCDKTGSKNWQKNWLNATTRSNIATVAQDGLQLSEGASWFDHIELRVRNGGSDLLYTNVNAENRAFSNYTSTGYPFPTLLEFEAVSKKQRVDSLYFEGTANTASRSITGTATFIDRCNYTIFKELERYHEFYQLLMESGIYLQSRGWSYKVSEAKYIFGRPWNRLSTDFPLTIPKSILHTWYMNCFVGTVNANESTYNKMSYAYDKNYPSIPRATMKGNLSNNNRLFWQDHVIHLNRVPYKMSKTKGTITVSEMHNIGEADSWIIYAGYANLVTRKLLSDYWSTMSEHVVPLYIYWRSMNQTSLMMGKTAQQVRNRKSGDVIFTANRRKQKTGCTYTFLAGNKINSIPEDNNGLFLAGSNNWYEKE